MRPRGVYPDGMPDNIPAVKRRLERRQVKMTATLVIEGDEADYLGDIKSAPAKPKPERMMNPHAINS